MTDHNCKACLLQAYILARASTQVEPAKDATQFAEEADAHWCYMECALEDEEEGEDPVVMHG